MDELLEMLVDATQRSVRQVFEAHPTEHLYYCRRRRKSLGGTAAAAGRLGARTEEATWNEHWSA